MVKVGVSYVIPPAMKRPVVNGLVLPVQLVPLEDVAIVFPPEPTATHKLFLYVIPFPPLVKVVEPLPVQVFPPSKLVAIVFVPEPTAIQRSLP